MGQNSIQRFFLPEGQKKPRRRRSGPYLLVYIVDSIPNSKRRIKVGLQLRQSWFLNSILLNMETWHNVQDSDLQIFMKLDQYLIRQIVGSQSKVPIEFLYLETSAIPVDFILTSRRLNYLHTVLSQSDSEMTKRIYLAQKSNPIKGNWVHHIKEDLEKVGIIQDDNELSAMKKSAFKSLLK